MCVSLPCSIAMSKLVAWLATSFIVGDFWLIRLFAGKGRLVWLLRWGNLAKWSSWFEFAGFVMNFEVFTLRSFVVFSRHVRSLELPNQGFWTENSSVQCGWTCQAGNHSKCVFADSRYPHAKSQKLRPLLTVCSSVLTRYGCAISTSWARL